MKIPIVAAAGTALLLGALAGAPAATGAETSPGGKKAKYTRVACQNPASGTIKIRSKKKVRRLTKAGKPICPEGWEQIVIISAKKPKNGRNGQNGKNGKNGRDGANGTNGTNGTNGANGKDGKDGLNGKDGSPVNVMDGEGNVVGQYLTKISVVPMLSVFQVLSNNGSYIYHESGLLLGGTLMSALSWLEFPSEPAEMALIEWTNSDCTGNPVVWVPPDELIRALYASAVGGQGRFVSRFEDGTIKSYRMSPVSDEITVDTNFYHQQFDGSCVASSGSNGFWGDNPRVDGWTYLLQEVTAPKDHVGPLTIDRPRTSG